MIAGPHPERRRLAPPEAGDTRAGSSRWPGCGSRSRPTSAATRSTPTSPRTRCAAADRLRDAGATVQRGLAALGPGDDRPGGQDPLRHDLRRRRCREIYEQHGDELTSYARRLVAESDQITKDDFVAGLALEAEIYAPLGELLEEYDALICPTFAVPALPAEYDTDDRVEVNGQPARALVRRA